MAIRQPIVTVAGHVDHGKCVSGDTLIPLVDGTITNAKELFEKNFDIEKAQKIEDGILQNIKEKNIQIFSFDGKDIIKKDISHIWKREAEKLIEITTSSGDIIKTTGEHPFFILDNLKIKEKKAEDLEKGEYIAIPKKISLKEFDIADCIIKKLKVLPNFVCFLSSASDSFIEKIKKQNITNIEKTLKIKNLRDSLIKKRFRIKDFFMLSSYFKISDKDAYSLIGRIKNANEGWRVGHTSKTISPPNMNELEKFGYILGCLAGDGHISNGAILNNNDQEIHEAYMSYLKEVFDIDSEIKQGHTCQIVRDKGGLTFARFLFDIIGFPKKNKSAEIFVPEIVKKNKQMFRGFFSGLFDTDGYASHLNYSIEITSKSKMLIKECSILLLNFGVHSAVYKKSGYYVLRISNKIYLNKFLENFNPRLKRKLSRVINASKKAETSRIFDFLPISGAILKELKMCGKINKKIPYFNKYKKLNKIPIWLIKKTLENIKKENETSQKIRGIVEQELYYVEIISKRCIKNDEDYVYDFSIPDTHNFVAERALIHNTSLLDMIRGSSVAETEAGRITQKISFTLFPAESIKKGCYLLDKYDMALKIPGFLFIDTPGHAAFTNLRKRGGSLADLAILVIDINEGIMPQTAEVISILKANKTPFVVALNKIDAISGWRKQDEELKDSIDKQASRTKQDFDEKLYTLIGALNSYGFEAEIFYNIKDFTKNLALVPCSAKTGEGIPELLMMLCGLSQRFLKERLNLKKDAKGVILEIKKEKAIQYIESILYDGELKEGDEIAIATFNEPIITKIRAVQEILPLSKQFKPVKQAKAATGLRLQLIEKKDMLPGMPFQIYKNNMEEIKNEFRKEITEIIHTDKEGIIVKAESLGSVEAILRLLRQDNINICKAGIGNINKNDITSAAASLETSPLDAIIIGFNVELDEDAKGYDKRIGILTGDVVYKIIDDLKKLREQKQKEAEREKMLGMTTICKLEILQDYVFRNTKPAIFGVKIVHGKITPHTNLIAESNEAIGKIKSIQSQNKPVQEAVRGMEVAISIPGLTFDRQLGEEKFLYSEISEGQFRKFKENKELLTSDEISCLQEIAVLRRKQKATWGI